MEKKEYTKQYANFEIKDADVDFDKRTFTAIITNQHVDHDKEIVLRDGLNVKVFKSNGIILSQHDSSKPLGTTYDIRKSGEGWKIKAKFAEVDTPALDYIDGVYSLVKQGVLKTMSIGYLPTEQRRPTDVDRKTYGKDVRVITSKAILLEASIVSVPCNSEALIQTCKELNLDPKDYGVEVEEEEVPDIVIEDTKDFDNLVAKIKEDLVIEYKKDKKKQDIKDAIKEQIIISKLFKNGTIYY